MRGYIYGVTISKKQSSFYVCNEDNLGKHRWVEIEGYAVAYDDYHFFYYKQGNLFVLCHDGSGDIICIEESRKEMIESLKSFMGKRNVRSILANVMRSTYKISGRNPKYC